MTHYKVSLRSQKSLNPFDHSLPTCFPHRWGKTMSNVRIFNGTEALRRSRVTRRELLVECPGPDAKRLVGRPGRMGCSIHLHATVSTGRPILSMGKSNFLPGRPGIQNRRLFDQREEAKPQNLSHEEGDPVSKAGDPSLLLMTQSGDQ